MAGEAEERERALPASTGGCDDKERAALEREVPDPDVVSGDIGSGERDEGRGGVQVELGLWKRPTYHGTTSKVSLYCTKQALSGLFSTIARDPPARALFERSCFGAYINMDMTGVTCGAAIHTLFGKEVNTLDARKDEVWFRVGEKNIRFSKIEFALLTGLRFGVSRVDTTVEHSILDDNLYCRYYPRRQGVPDLKPLVNALIQRFHSREFRTRSVDDHVKIFKIIFVYCFVLGADVTKRRVDSWVSALIDDGMAWESFIKSLSDRARQQYHFYGCSMAFVVWVCEAIPSFALHCATLRSAPEHQRPRVLR